MTEAWMQDQPQLNRPRESATWSIGTSAFCAETVTRGEGVLLAGLFGAAPLARASSEVARVLVQRCWEEHFEAELETATVETIEEAARTADDALRARYSPSDPEGRGTAVLALFDAGTVHLVGTLGAVAYLVRHGSVVSSWQAGLQSGSSASMAPHEYLGGRPSDSSDVVVATMSSPWVLQPEDRVVLATRDLRAWLHDGQLAELASDGALESAAQTLSEITNLRGSGMEVGTAVVEWATESTAELFAADDEWSDVLETLEDLVPQLTDPGIQEEPEAPAYDDEDATAGFAPLREREHARGEAVLSLTPSWAPDPSEVDALREAPEQENLRTSTTPAATPRIEAPPEAPVETPRSRLPLAAAALVLFSALALASAWFALAGP